MPLDQALKYAIQIADALDRAHRSGVFHRDVKPANIMVTRDGCKVLDFGLAKTALRVGPDDATGIASALTGVGTILGTPQYMAPEQYEGKEADARSDIFAFGCVVYEMVTGKRSFDGKNRASLIAAVLGADPAPMSAIVPVTPPALERLVQRCLAKDPEDRYQSMRDVVLDLRSIAEGGQEVQATRLKSRVPVFWPWVAAGVCALIAAGLALVHFREKPLDEPAIFANVPIPPNSTTGFLAISPDGRRLVLSFNSEGKSQLYVRSLDSPQLRPLANTDNARAFFWSPDGKFVAFFADGKLKIIPAVGGLTQSLCDDTGLGRGGTWNRDGIILFADAQGTILRVNAAGGACTPVIKPEKDAYRGFPAFLADGGHFLYFASSPDDSKRGIYLASLDDPKGRRLLAELSGPIYTPPRPGSRYGHVLFLRGTSTLMAQPFDERALQLAGDPFVVTEQASLSNTNPQPAADASANGILAYIANVSRDLQLTWFDRTGKELGTAGPRNQLRGVALSPDGKTLATTVTQNGIGGVWLRDLARDSESRLAETGTAAVWSPDGSRVIYTKRNDLYVRGAAGGGDETIVLANGNLKTASDWSRDGRYLLYTETDSKTQGDIWYLENPPSGGGKPVRFLGTNAMESQGQLSPDGRWIAYTSNDSGSGEIYIRPFPSGPGEWKVSVRTGAEPRWSADGKEIYYLERSVPLRLMAASVKPGPGNTLEIGVPRKLFEYSAITNVPTGNIFSYSPAAGGRFLATVSTDIGPPAVNVISNWQKFAAGAKGQ
jgi:Tol biopolymer transport system component